MIRSNEARPKTKWWHCQWDNEGGYWQADPAFDQDASTIFATFSDGKLCSLTADLLYEDRPTDDDFREAVRVATGIVLPTMRDAAVRVVEGVIAKRLPPRTDKHDPIWDMADIEELASDVCHALGLEQP